MKKTTLIITYCLLLSACFTMGIKGEKGIEYVLQLSEKSNANQLQEKTIEILSERLKEYGYADKQISFNVLPKNQLKVNIEAIDDLERVKKLLLERGYFSMKECFSQEEAFAKISMKEIDFFLQSDFENKVDSLRWIDNTQAAADIEENTQQRLLSSLFSRNDRLESAELGYALAKDTAQVSRYLNSSSIKKFFPDNATFMWSRSPHQYSEEEDFFTLYAVKISTSKKDYLDNGDILEAHSNKDYNDLPVVNVSFHESSHQKLERLSAMNINKAILIILNSQVVSAPNVMTKLTGGKIQITGDFSDAEIVDLANILSQKALPANVELLSEKVSNSKKKE